MFMLPLKAIQMSLGQAATWDHIEVHGPCCPESGLISLAYTAPEGYDGVCGLCCSRGQCCMLMSMAIRDHAKVHGAY